MAKYDIFYETTTLWKEICLNEYGSFGIYLDLKIMRPWVF